MARASVIIVFVAVAIGGLIAAYSLIRLVVDPKLAFQAILSAYQTGWPIYLLLAQGFIGGALLTALLFSSIEDGAVSGAWVYIAVCCLAILAIAAAHAHELSFIRAALVILFGSAALVTAGQTMALLRQGESIELTTHWGGFGGTLGGWRLSRVATLILLALAFFGGAVGSATTRFNDNPPGAPAAGTVQNPNSTNENSTGRTEPSAGKHSAE